MFKIERALSGLFDYLKVSSQGQVPRELAQVVQPVLDISTLALRQMNIRTRHIPASPTPLVPGIVADSILTSDLLVCGVSIECFASAAAQSAQLGLYYRRPISSTSPFQLGQAFFGPSIDVGQVMGATWYLGNPVWMPKGSSVYLFCSYVAGAMEGFGQLLAYDPANSA